ncbi:hypothetical protein ANCCEY_03080 [Ancylostoma ceylanicum]|uniref:Uncharacterized protein n=1 Tax=Ancylostoma ceylanicum TaxID=53326 RepID=A0A0D6MBL2_9BILA|nr:hypothetical protein ANCCEY_03080 [Ancylostoma ceylanicum]
MADEGADEVKVFRRTDAEDLETNAQSSHQLAEDKKDVVLETELESRPNGDPLIDIPRDFCIFLTMSIDPEQVPLFFSLTPFVLLRIPTAILQRVWSAFR